MSDDNCNRILEHARAIADIARGMQSDIPHWATDDYWRRWLSRDGDPVLVADKTIDDGWWESIHKAERERPLLMQGCTIVGNKTLGRHKPRVLFTDCAVVPKDPGISLITATPYNWAAIRTTGSGGRDSDFAREPAGLIDVDVRDWLEVLPPKGVDPKGPGKEAWERHGDVVQCHLKASRQPADIFLYGLRARCTTQPFFLRTSNPINLQMMRCDLSVAPVDAERPEVIAKAQIRTVVNGEIAESKFDCALVIVYDDRQPDYLGFGGSEALGIAPSTLMFTGCRIKSLQIDGFPGGAASFVKNHTLSTEIEETHG